MIARNDILAALERADQLPPFPEVVIRLERELSNPDVSLDRIVRLLEKDVALVAQLMRVANSAYYSGISRLSSVKDAAIRLGTQELRRIVYSATVIGRYRQLCHVDADRFWSHSLTVAMTARVVSEFSKRPIPRAVQEASYVAGLLHDLGAIALMHWFPKEYAETTIDVREHGGTASEYELTHWGMEHGEVGGLLAESWHLPMGVQQAIACHHQPWLAGPSERELVYLVHIADFICTNQGYGRDDYGFPRWFDPNAWDSLGLSLDEASAIIQKVRAQAEKSSVLVKVLAP